MENLLLSAASSAHQTLPDARFVVPAEHRPPASPAGAATLPVIDLSLPRAAVRAAVLAAGRELGFFQVVNHGVPLEAMRDVEAACADFFRLPAAAKAAYYSDDADRTNRLFTSTVYEVAGERYWRDCLRLAVFPVDDATRAAWPDRPPAFRAAMERFIVPTRAVGMELLTLLCEGIGLRPDYFDGELSGGATIVNVNHYPPCPDTARTLGLPPHCDRNLITLLLQGPVSGLQVAHGGGGRWIDVEPVPGAFVVNFGHQLEIATNGLLKSVEHRAVTNAAVARTSVATFIMPTMDSVIRPADELLAAAGEPPRYRSFTFREFMGIYKTVGARRESVEKAFKI
ncbi:hypothetical protein ACP4OV_021803 [Aristida adscensionis]